MEALGINPVLLIAQLISFGVLFFVLNKFLYSKVRKALEDRREAVRRAIDNEAVTQKKVLELEEERIKLEKKNHAEVKALLASAQKNAEEIKKEILAETDIRGKKMIEDARVKIEEEKLRAQDELREQATLLAKEMAVKVLMKETKSGKAGIDNSIEELRKAAKNK